ncbi:MAG: phosphomannomutase/phosphoglucomutase [Planctomycetes bacterium]|nr:phosphomannomutase/phosphoglucomutase [Planctomycetota bacterium]
MIIFKAYDIRGIYPDELDEALMKKIGNAVAQFIDGERLLVSRDMRKSGESLSKAFIDGATDAGVDCVDAGLLSTPGNYFAIASYGFPGGVEITASHNPKQYNGLKVSRENAIPVGSETGLAEIEKMVTGGEYKTASVKGKVTRMSVIEDLKKHVLKFASGIKPLKVAIDAGNGMAGLTLPAVLDELPIETERLYFDLDGAFPNHEANPLKAENMRDLQEAVRRSGADLGVAFDGDADRCAFVDEKGEIIPCDLVTAIIARDMLKDEPGGLVLYDLRSSRVVPEEIEAAGGRGLAERVGHAFMKATLREKNGLCAGELSGHYYFRDNFYADSAAIGFVKLLNVISAAGIPLSEIVKPLRRYFNTGEVNFEVEDKDAKIREMAGAFGDAKISYLDGISVEYDDWWFNVRKSNTEPLLRLVLEAKTQILRDEGFRRVSKIIGKPAG